MLLPRVRLHRSGFVSCAVPVSCATLYGWIAGAEPVLDGKRGRSLSQMLRWILGPFSALNAQILRKHHWS